MTIEFACATCGKSYDVRDDLAGRRVRCKQCGGEMRVPGVDPAPPAGPFVDVSAARAAIVGDPPRPPAGLDVDLSTIDRAALGPDPLGVFLRVACGIGTPPARSGPGPEPMNSVGLFALLLSFASYGLAASAIGLAVLMLWGGSGREFHYPAISLPLFIYSGPGVALAAFALLCCRLGRQAIVRPFGVWGLRACAWIALPASPFFAWEMWRIYDALRSLSSARFGP